MARAMHTAILAGTLLALAARAAAHHSPAMFDQNAEVVFEGEIASVSWRNPHVYFALRTVAPDGSARMQQIEAGPASNLVTLGMRADTLRPGDRVTVRAKPHRQGGERVALGWLLTRSDGSVIPLHVRAMASDAPVAGAATSMAGTWVPQGTAFAALSFAAREWPLTDRGRAAIAAKERAKIQARAACVPFGPPALMALPNTTIVEVGAAQVTFRLDVMDVERIVHLDQDRHPDPLEPTLHGHSIGWWEGGTLVVDTVGYLPHPEGYAFDLPSSGAKHVVERFTLSADRKHIEYEAVVEDPEYLAAPVTHRSLWDYRPDQRPSGLPCEPDVARRYLDEE